MPLIQPKLKIGQPNDKYEQEADRVADEVMRMPEPNVQRQVQPGEEKEVIQKKPIASKITPLVQRQVSDEDDEEPVQIKSHASSGTIQRQEPDGKPKSNEDETKEALKKTGEAFLETAPGKAIVKKGKEVVTSLPGTVITGTAAVGAITTLIATNKALPIQAPAIPLDKLHPGLSMRITVEGPLRAPTKGMISFSGKLGLPKRQGRQNPVKTESEKLSEENARMQREQFEFRESLKTPEEKDRDNQGLVDQLSKRLVLPGLKSQKDVSTIEKKKEETAIQRKEANGSNDVVTDTSMVQEVTQSTGKPLDSITRHFMEQRFGHDFSQVKIHNSGKAKESVNAVNAKAYTVGHNIVFGPGHYAPGTRIGNHLLSHELTHVLQQCARGDRNTIQRVPSKSSQSMEDPSPPLTQKPDKTFAARLRRLRTGCIKDGSIVVATAIDENDSDKATGLLEVTYEGEGRTKFTSDQPTKERLFPKGKTQRNENGKFCFCDCMHYRQYIQGIGWEGPVDGSANRPILEITSRLIKLPLDGQWHEENVGGSALGKGLGKGCKREFTDKPGFTGGAKAGVPLMLRYNFYLQIWDACQQRELWHDVRALTVDGSMPPRSILWSSLHQPLTRESISTVTPEVNEKPDRLNSMRQKQQI